MNTKPDIEMTLDLYPVRLPRSAWEHILLALDAAYATAKTGHALYLVDLIKSIEAQVPQD